MSLEDYEKAAENYQWVIDNFGNYKDAASELALLKRKIETIKNEEEQRIKKNKRKKITISVGSLVGITIVLFVIVNFVIIPTIHYNEGLKLIENGSYDEAVAVFEGLGNYKDSSDKIILAQNSKKYDNAVELFENGSYETAENVFGSLGSFKDAREQKNKAHECYLEEEYNKAIKLFEAGSYEAAKNAFDKLGTFSDSQEQKRKAHEYYLEERYNEALRLLENNSFDEAVNIFSSLGYYKDSADKIQLARYNKAVLLVDDGLYSMAAKEFSQLGDYKDSKELLINAEINAFKTADNNIAVSFGNYQWYVIEKNDNTFTLLCKDIVGDRAYNKDRKDITWEKCALRSYLNNTFYNSFSDEEKVKIIKTKCANKDNVEYKTSGGNDTEDYIYLLSIDEAETLTTDVLKASKWWWLRSPGHYQNNAAYVGNGGSVRTQGNYVGNGHGGVRPVMRIKFEE